MRALLFDSHGPLSRPPPGLARGLLAVPAWAVLAALALALVAGALYTVRAARSRRLPR